MTVIEIILGLILPIASWAIVEFRDYKADSKRRSIEQSLDDFASIAVKAAEEMKRNGTLEGSRADKAIEIFRKRYKQIKGFSKKDLDDDIINAIIKSKVLELGFTKE